METYFLSSGCASYPTTFYEWFTAYVNGLTYTGPAATVTLDFFSTVYATHTFPALTVTALTPGEPITLVYLSTCWNYRSDFCRVGVFHLQLC